MKFTCYTQDIRDALKFAVKCAATKKPDIQILIAAKLTADDGKLTIATTDFNLGALVALPVNIAENGSCAVNAKFLLDVISKLDNDTVTFDDASGRLNVQSGATSFNISVFDADDFPTPKFDCETSLYIRAKILKDLIRQSAFAVDKGIDRPILTAVHLELNRDGADPILTATATNAQRVVQSNFVVDSVREGSDFNVNVPANALKILAAELPDDVEFLVALGTDDRTFTAKFNNIYFKSSIVEGTFPEVKKLFEAERPILANVNTTEFKIVLNRVNLVARDADFGAVRLCLTPGKLIVRADSDRDSVEEILEAVTSEECDLVIAFHPAYMLDFLNAVDGNKVQLCFDGANAPAEIVDRDNLHIHYVLTPINLG